MTFSVFKFGLLLWYILTLSVSSQKLSEFSIRQDVDFGSGISTVQNSDITYSVLITNEYLNTPCSGVLVSKDTVLSAAHCLVVPQGEESFSKIKIIIGNSSNLTDYQNSFGVKSISLHPGWINVAPFENDLAILSLDGCVDDDLATPGKIHLGDLDPSGEMYQYSHGLYGSNGYIESGLVKIKTVFGGSNTCVISHHDSVINGNLLCTKVNPNSKFCFGDSGGALVRSNDSSILGISSQLLSNSYPCTSTSSVGVYIHLGNFVEFFKSQGAVCTSSECQFLDSCDEFSSNSESSFFNTSSGSTQTVGIVSTLTQFSMTTNAQISPTSVNQDVNSLQSISIDHRYDFTINNRSLNGDYNSVQFNYNITHQLICIENGFELHFNARQSRDLQFEISNGNLGNRSASILARFGLSTMTFSLTFVDFEKNIETISIGTQAKVSPMTNYNLYVKFDTCGVYIGADSTQIVFLPADKFDISGFISNNNLVGYFDTYTTSISTISNSLNIFCKSDLQCSGNIVDISSNSPCKVDLISGLSFDLGESFKQFTSSTRIPIPCRKNSFSLTFDVISSNDFYIQVSPVSNLSSTNKTVTFQLGIQSGRNSVNAISTSVTKRSILGNGDGISHVILTYNNSVITAVIDNNTPIVYNDPANSTFSYINFAPFTGTATMSNIILKCTDSDSCS
ncbi:Granzyme M [Smittium mucronatum]|uniref:Granzyme M n=1 Tax=Smittium mucronatum TaxID=133383 RepID=A0A1R0H623_9FUNG|nr:Granzyme M [Smittium mucronatum]